METEAIPMETSPAQELSKTIDALISEIKATTISTQEQYTFVNEWLHRNKDTQKAVDTFFEPDRVEAKAKYDDVLANKNAFKKPLEAAEKIARDKMTEFATEQEKKRRAELKIEEDKKRKEIEDDRLLKAEELAAMGRSEKADEVMDKKVSVKNVETETKKVGKTIEIWTVTVVSKELFLADAVGFPAVLDCFEINTIKLAAIAKSDAGAFLSKIQGLKVEQSFRPVL